MLEFQFHEEIWNKSLSTALIGGGVRDNFNAPLLSTSSLVHLHAYPLTRNQIFLPSSALR